MKGKVKFVSLAALAALVVAGCNRGGDNLAVVNGEAITMTEFHRYLERKPVVQVVTESGAVDLPVAGSLGFQALKDLVNRRILLQIAKDENVFPTDADVTAELDFQKKRRPSFLQDLTQQGMQLEEIQQDLKLDLAKERVLTKGITVVQKDVDEFIKGNPDKFENPAQANLRIVIVRDEASKKKVDSELATGAPFGTVAQKYSISTTARNDQGRYPVSVISQMRPALQAIVNATPEGKATDWKNDNGQFVKIYVESKIAAKPVKIDDTMREFVRRQLALEKGNQATDLGKRLVDKLKAATVTISSTSLQKPWDEAFKRLKEQDVNAATATPGAAPGAAPTGGAPAPAAGK